VYITIISEINKQTKREEKVKEYIGTKIFPTHTYPLKLALSFTLHLP
jgi:hypothetical protein